MLQGLSPGWGDTYDYYRPEQWIDLGQGKLADGQYVLRSVADPLNMVYESPSKATGTESAEDNEAITAVQRLGRQTRRLRPADRHGADQRHRRRHRLAERDRQGARPRRHQRCRAR